MLITYEEYVELIKSELSIDISPREDINQTNSTIMIATNYINGLLCINDSNKAQADIACAFYTYYELYEENDEITGEKVCYDYLKNKDLLWQ
ncbi:MAG: hypothetical protein EHM25_00305 [Nitrosopumilales archaeon]|nr:MAG: hypothetical protein EHM25_12570 [Nitrosopumilales archaeon]RPJ31530.1 MAG: hypothetical protein EHM25_02535 [Nitrosopumilales archaeon]RPJ32727.1 MAG: hypothetical protein EHM25_00305 [Nitrosopumilales archaeon]